MYININIDDEIGTQMTAMAKSRDQPIEILVHEAIIKWLHHQIKKTPTLFALPTLSGWSPNLSFDYLKYFI